MISNVFAVNWDEYYTTVIFNIWYYQNFSWGTGISPSELIDFIQTHPPWRALDFGCGTSTNTITFTKHGKQGTGLNYIVKAIKHAPRKASQSDDKIDFFNEDVARLNEVHGIFDLNPGIGCFHTLGTQDKIQYIKNIVILLADKGTFLINGWIKNASGKGYGILPGDIKNLSNCLD